MESLTYSAVVGNRPDGLGCQGLMVGTESRERGRSKLKFPTSDFWRQTQAIADLTKYGHALMSSNACNTLPQSVEAADGGKELIGNLNYNEQLILCKLAEEITPYVLFLFPCSESYVRPVRELRRHCSGICSILCKG